jgi:membrane associated rhomboid family serine protease
VVACPRCGEGLVKHVTPPGVVYVCPGCEGRDVAIPVLRKAGARGDFLNRVWLDAKHEDVERVLRCPHCHAAMAQVTARAGDHALDLDVCTYCNAIWFDHGELRALPRDPNHVHDEELSLKAREQAALLALQTQEEEEAASTAESPPEGWRWLPAIFGLPVECDAPLLKGKPWLTWSIAGVLVMTFVVTFGSLERVVQEWGFVPALWARHGGLTLATSFLLHAGLPHLLSNLYFLLVFGDNVEDRLGPARFVLLLAGSTLAGHLLHAALDPKAMTPCIGASGGIFGILGYYALAFPTARIGFILWVRWVQMPAIAMLALYVFIEIVGAWQQVAGFGSVSSLAHLGGLAVGIGAALAVRMTRNRPMDFGTPQEEPRTP